MNPPAVVADPTNVTPMVINWLGAAVFDAERPGCSE
jgi:hypothetical protein